MFAAHPWSIINDHRGRPGRFEDLFPRPFTAPRQARCSGAVRHRACDVLAMAERNVRGRQHGQAAREQQESPSLTVEDRLAATIPDVRRQVLLVNRESVVAKAAGAPDPMSGQAELASDERETAPRSTTGAGLGERTPSDAPPSMDKAVRLRGPGLSRGSPSTTCKTRASGDNEPRGLPGVREATSPWLTYPEAAAYCGWSVSYLRNLVCAGRIPVYGRLRVRRFRRDMLDLFLTDPDAAMRQFRAERNAHGS